MYRILLSPEIGKHGSVWYSSGLSLVTINLLLEPDQTRPNNMPEPSTTAKVGENRIIKPQNFSTKKLVQSLTTLHCRLLNYAIVTIQ